MAGELSEFTSMVSAQVDLNKDTVEECKEYLQLSLGWIALHLSDERHNHCHLLTKGCYGTAVEAVSLLAFGLIRPAILSLRAHYELELQFLYYRDHPIEWRSVMAFRTQPTLPSVNKKYLRDFFPAFAARFKTLTANCSRAHEDCYAVLSGVAHGTAIHSVSTATKPQELVEDEQTVASAKTVFKDVAETISDINVACYESNWLSLPQLVQENLTTRFVGKQPGTELMM